LIVGWRRMSNSRRRNGHRRRSRFRRRNSRWKRGRRRRSRGKRSSRMSKTMGNLVFKIRTIYHQVGRELGRLPQPQHRNVQLFFFFFCYIILA